MYRKSIGRLAILGIAGVLIAGCGDEPEVDAGSNSRAPAIESWGNWPVTADGAIRRELAELEAERAAGNDDSGDWPMTADGAIRRELARLEAERAAGG